MKKVNQQTAVMRKVMIIVLALLIVPVMYAFAGPRGLGGEVGAPIDGGISLLVAAGVGYGVKKVRESRKKTKKVAEMEEAETTI